MNLSVDLCKLLRKPDFTCIIILLFFIFLSSKAIFHKGFFRTIDDITTVRIEYLEKELRRNNWFNNFPVRISGELSNNHGYPLYLFYAPLTYYVGVFFKFLFSISYIVTTKYVYIFPLLFGPFAFYFAARQKIPPFPALVAAIFFTLFPYRGFNTYIRGAVGEAWAISLIPLAIGGLFLLQKNKKIGGIIFTVAFFLILISHNLVGVLFTGLALLYGLFFLIKNWDFWKFFLLAFGMSAFFLIPMIYYLKIVKVSYHEITTTYILKTLVPLNEMLNIKIYRQGSSGEQLVAASSYILFFILIGGLAFFVHKKIKSGKNFKEVFFWGLCGFALYMLLFEPFRFFWQWTLQYTGIFQFSWRLLSLIGFITPLFLGFWLANLKKLYIKITIVLFIVAASLNFLPAFKPEAYSYFYEYKPEGPCATTSWQNEFLPVWVNGCPPAKESLEISPESKVKMVQDTPLSIKADITVNKETQLIVNKYYFPGWQILVDGRDSPLDYHFSVDGIFKTSLTPGKHMVEVVYKKTPIMWLADLISFASFGILARLICRISFKKQNY